jgi:phthiocerol/phenolphthiocerol synthesis type-I polyketide synthase E
LWCSGANPDWAGFHSGRRRLRIPLPTYPFDRRRFWINPWQVQAADRIADNDPAPDLEARLTSIWRVLLGLDCIKPQDNFFELGGDSLLATKVVSRIIADLNVPLPLNDFLEAPTIADLATALRNMQAAEPSEHTSDELLSRVRMI